MNAPASPERRQLLLASLLIPCFAACGDTASRREIWISAQGSTAEDFGAGWLEPDGRTQQLQVGFRGHDIIQHPRRRERALLIARRPGRQMIELDLVEHRVVRRIDCTENHEQGGHACFSADGHALFSAESDYELGEGRIVVRDAEDYRVLDEYPSHGIGPHEIALMPDGQTLAVANGGLRTHPDTGRAVLNLESMRSRLTFMNSRSGELLSEHRVAESKASIRHIDVNDRGEVSVALQMQREAADHDELAPLAGVYDEEHGLRIFDAPESLLWRCNDYMGSTRLNPKTRIAGYTSPRGDIALFWNLDTRELAGYHRFHDVCGIAVSLDQSEFILSNSAGQIRRLDALTLEPRARQLDLDGFEWDNHLRAIELPARQS